jgi:hypothetical protein
LANKLFEQTTKDFGTCQRGAQLKHRFKITNIYAVPLDITDVRYSSHCVYCVLSHKTLKPQESGYLEVTMDAGRFTGDKTVPIFVTVGPNVSTAELTVRAKSGTNQKQ